MEEIDGGAPERHGPLAIEFANTRYAVRGDLQEGLATPANLAAWLHSRSVAVLPAADAADLARFVALRDAIRALARAVVDELPAPQPALDVVNRSAAGAPRWPALGADLAVTEHTAAGPAAGALAAVARSAVAVLSGPDRARLRACQGPGCVLFFVKQHPRREWCSDSCGNRARVGRYYQRHRTDLD